MVLTVLYTVFAVLFLFGLCIFVHELGHFAAARALGMTVEVFSLGFGPALWKRKINGIYFKVGLFPIGGYVSLPQMDPGGQAAAAVEGRAPLPSVQPWKKIVVALAGAAGNMLLAYLVAWIVYAAGKPSAPAERSAVIGYVETNSAAYEAGLRAGDEILSVNNFAVGSWHEVIQESARFEKVELLVASVRGTNLVGLATVKSPLGLRVIPGLHEVTLCRVIGVEPDSPAARAGIDRGDLIRTLDGVEVLSISHLIALVSARIDQPADIEIERAGRRLVLSVVPRLDPDLQRARIGIRFDPYALDTDRVVHIPPGAQIKSHAQIIFRVLRSLVTPGEAKATSQSLGGPLMIVYMLQDMVRRGIVIALWFICLLNVNLAILNLVPLPVLDGGHVVFALWETVFRRPVPRKVVAFLDQVFFVLLIGLIILISFRDVSRLGQILRMNHPAPDPAAASGAAILPANTNASVALPGGQIDSKP